MAIQLLYCAKNQLLADATQSEPVQFRQFRQRYFLQVYPHYQECISDWGKPLSHCPSDLVFNQSHSQSQYLLAYSQNVSAIGVDIEDKQRQANMQMIAQRKFHPKEWQTWQATGFNPLFWLKVWTIKEAVLKAHGMGIRIALNSLNSQAHPLWDFGQVEHPQLGRWLYQCMDLPNSLACVVYPWQGQFEKINIANIK